MNSLWKETDAMSDMNPITRRALFAGALAAAPLARAAAPPKIRIGVTDWNLRKGANLESVALAASLGFEGVEISFGRQAPDGRLQVDRPHVIEAYLEEFRKHKIAIAGTCVDRLHVNCLKNDLDSGKWVRDSIRLTRRLGANVLLLPFFGNCELKTRDEMDNTAAALRILAREAADAGVTLGLENTISAENNARILDQVNSPGLKVYYDPGNSINSGHDPYKELRWLGAERICQIHIKDNPNYLGEGRLRWPELLQIIAEIGYEGFANLETSSPSGDVAADMRRNLAYVRSEMNKMK
jgi:L-ribulose-5-phosphate 3-epimerase